MLHSGEFRYQSILEAWENCRQSVRWGYNSYAALIRFLWVTTSYHTLAPASRSGRADSSGWNRSSNVTQTRWSPLWSPFGVESKDAGVPLELGCELHDHSKSINMRHEAISRIVHGPTLRGTTSHVRKRSWEARMSRDRESQDIPQTRRVSANASSFCKRVKILQTRQGSANLSRFRRLDGIWWRSAQQKLRSHTALWPSFNVASRFLHTTLHPTVLSTLSKQ